MNYIKHLTGFFEKVAQDRNLNATHVSLYVALFQFWNFNRFKNPISISRDEVMRISKISSKATYHKCLKNLHALGYFDYQPSYNPFKGSQIVMFDFSEDLKPLSKYAKTSSEQVIEIVDKQALINKRTTSKIGIKQALVPIINNINITKESNENKEGAPISKINYQFFNNSNSLNQNLAYQYTIPENSFLKKEKSCAKKEKEQWNDTTENLNVENIIPPPFEELINFFKELNAPLIEAQKFFNHYESNGWLVAGKSKMKNWKASVENWLEKSNRFNSISPNHIPSPKNLQATTNKSYKEPL